MRVRGWCIEAIAKFMDAHRKAFNLAFNATIVNDETAELLVAKAFNDSKAVAIEANILTSATVGDILAKAQRVAKAIKGQVKESAASEGA